MDVLLVTGGSGGHLVPALALADRLKGKGSCVMLSTRRPVDRILSSAAGNGLVWVAVELEGISPLRRWLSPRFAARQIEAIGRVRETVRRARPDVVVGFGGYLSAVGVAAARREGIPVVIHEQNVIPGGANRWSARMSQAVAVSFAGAEQAFRGHRRVEVTGNPIRLRPGGMGPAEARRRLGFDPERPVLLVMGGSQGSSAVNRLALAMWEERPPEDRARAQVLHLAGPDAEEVQAAYRRLGISHRVLPFLHEMEMAFSAATLAVSRAGATAITEMAAFGVPAVLVPYPHAKQHQLANARWMEKTGGAVVLEEPGLTPARLWQGISDLLEDAPRLERMGLDLRAQWDGLAADRLAALVREVAGAAPAPATSPVRAELVEARTSVDARR